MTLTLLLVLFGAGGAVLGGVAAHYGNLADLQLGVFLGLAVGVTLALVALRPRTP